MRNPSAVSPLDLSASVQDESYPVSLGDDSEVVSSRTLLRHACLLAKTCASLWGRSTLRADFRNSLETKSLETSSRGDGGEDLATVLDLQGIGEMYLW